MSAMNTNFDLNAFNAVDQTEPTTELVKDSVELLTNLFSMKTSLQNELFHTRQLLDSNTRNYEQVSKSIELAEEKMVANPLAYLNNFHELKQYEAACINRVTSMMFIQQNHLQIEALEQSIDNMSKDIEAAINQFKGE